MDTIESLRCTICGSHHLTKVNENEYRCDNCDSIINKQKAEDYEKIFRKLTQEGKQFDIENIRRLIDKSLEGHINRQNLIKYCSDLLRYLPDDITSNFYIKFINRKTDPDAYIEYFNTIKKEASITEFNKIKDMIIETVQKREEKAVRDVFKKFYDNKYDEEITKSLKRREIEIELFSNIRRDVFICHSSYDRKIVDEVLKVLEDDGNTCWVSFRNIPRDSDNYWKNIEDAIKSCDIFLCVSSQYTNQSEDCRKEVEIASSLEKKKRIEYKIDDSRDITLFRNFFTGQWITSINDLPERVYEIKFKEKKLIKEALKFLNDGKYIEAKEKYLEVKEYSDDSSIDDQINLCSGLISAVDLMKEDMYQEAKAKLLVIDNIQYTKDLLDVCNQKLKVNQVIKEEVKVINTDGINEESLEKRAYVFLEDKNWKKADEYAEKMLDLNAKSPTGYIIKLLVSYKLKSVDELSSATVASFSDNKDYKKAISYSSGELKKRLIEINYKNNYEKGIIYFNNIKKASDYKIAATLFKNANDYKDAKDYYNKCLTLEKEYVLKEKYDYALKQKSEGKINLLKDIIDYKDSKKIIELEVNNIYKDICSQPLENRLNKLYDFKRKYGHFKNVDSKIEETEKEILENKYLEVCSSDINIRYDKLKEFQKENGDYKDIDKKIEEAARDKEEYDYNIACNAKANKLDLLNNFKNVYGDYKDINKEIEKAKNEQIEAEYKKACLSSITTRVDRLLNFKKSYGNYKDIDKKIIDAKEEFKEYKYQSLASLTGEEKLHKLTEFKNQFGSYKDIDKQIKIYLSKKRKKKFALGFVKILGILMILALLAFDCLLSIQLCALLNPRFELDNFIWLYNPLVTIGVWFLIQLIVYLISKNIKIKTIRILMTILPIIFGLFRISLIVAAFIYRNEISFVCIVFYLAACLTNILPYVMQILVRKVYQKTYTYKITKLLKIYISYIFIFAIMVFDIWVTISLRLKNEGVYRWLLLPLIAFGLWFIILCITVTADKSMFISTGDNHIISKSILILIPIIGIIRGLLIVTGSYLLTDNFIFYPELGQFIINGIVFVVMFSAFGFDS